MLSLHVVRAIHRAREHELPTEAQCLGLTWHDVKRVRVINHRDMPARASQLDQGGQMFARAGEGSDVARRTT